MPNVFGMVTTRASAEYTSAALETFFQNTPLHSDDQFLLIDNDGGCGGRPCPQAAEMVVNLRPFGFAENANQVIDRANRQDADAYVLNNDIVFTPGWLGPVSAAHPAVMTPTCNQNFQYKRGELELKPVMTLEEFCKGEKDLPAILLEHRAAHSHYVEAYKTNFFCVKIPPIVYRRVGLFDTRFGMAGGEDDDYCIRTYLCGFRVLVAEESYLVHFGGRATWNGPETRQQWAAREQHFIQIFQQKWGPALTHFLLRRDASILAQNPSLVAAQQRGGIAGLFTEMARRDRVDVADVLALAPQLTTNN